MYIPRQFREERPEALAAALRALQLATLITAAPDGYHASVVPMVLKEEDGRRVLETHVARPNPHWGAVAAPLPSLAVFQGPQAYVSPSWYPSKAEHGRVVPTWHYVTVHAHGPLEAVEDEGWLLAHLDDLTRANEAHRARPWGLGDAPGDFVPKLARAIVGLRLTVERLEGAWKLGQHRPEGDRLGAAAGLAAEPGEGPAVAAAMSAAEAARAG